MSNGHYIPQEAKTSKKKTKRRGTCMHTLLPWPSSVMAKQPLIRHFSETSNHLTWCRFVPRNWMTPHTDIHTGYQKKAFILAHRLT